MAEGSTKRPSIICRIVRQTEHALLISDGDQRVWFPKSQCEVYERADGNVDLFADEWILKDKGLI
jgi:hypothetical protein